MVQQPTNFEPEEQAYLEALDCFLGGWDGGRREDNGGYIPLSAQGAGEAISGSHCG